MAVRVLKAVSQKHSLPPRVSQILHDGLYQHHNFEPHEHPLGYSILNNGSIELSFPDRNTIHDSLTGKLLKVTKRTPTKEFNLINYKSFLLPSHKSEKYIKGINNLYLFVDRRGSFFMLQKGDRKITTYRTFTAVTNDVESLTFLNMEEVFDLEVI